MIRTLRLSQTAVLAWIAIACGTADPTTDDVTSDDDLDALAELEGFWQPSSVQGSNKCDTWTDLLLIPYLRLEENGGRLETYECRSPTDCESVPDIERFFEPVGDDLAGIETWTAAPCVLNARRALLTRLDDDTIQIDTLQVSAGRKVVTNDADLTCDEVVAMWEPDFERNPKACERIVAERVPDAEL